MRCAIQQKRVSIRRCARDTARTDSTARPWLIFHNYGLTQNARQRFRDDARHHIVFAGFQVGGSRGAHLVAGAGEVKIHGAMVPVRAAVSQLEGFSGHADADGDWAALAGVAPYPSRHRCVLLPWEALRDALEAPESDVSP